MIGKSGTLLLVVASLAVSALVVEGSFWLFTRWAEPVYPVVHYKTDERHVSLDCYDDHFAGTPDFVCGGVGELTYVGNANMDPALADLSPRNANMDPALADLSPRKVPNAIEIRLNGRGLRERPMAAFDARRDKIVVLVGDSFCFGQGVRVVDRFSNVLETRLNREHPAERYRIFNTCYKAWDVTWSAKRMYEYVKFFGRVDLVVYSFVLNDPIQDGRLQKKERELWGRLKLEGEVNDFMHLRTKSDVPRRRSARFLAGWDSYTLRWFALRVQRQQTARETIEWYRQLYTNNSYWPQTQELLRQMKDYCAAKGIAFSLVVWPVFHQLDAYPLTEVHEFIGAVAQQEGIHSVDLLPLFAGKDAQQYRVHPTDFHPNSRAHAEVAAFLYDAIPW